MGGGTESCMHAYILIVAIPFVISGLYIKLYLHYVQSMYKYNIICIYGCIYVYIYTYYNYYMDEWVCTGLHAWFGFSGLLYAYIYICGMPLFQPT